jgi:hypothetical protein
VSRGASMEKLRGWQKGESLSGEPREQSIIIAGSG